MKECALRLRESGWSRQDVCSVLAVFRVSRYRWAELFEIFGSVTPPPPLICGRPRIIEIATMNAINDIYARNCDVYLDELCWDLAVFHDIAISISALQAMLVRAGLTRTILHNVVSEMDEMRRVEFIHRIIRTNFSGTGDEFVCIDESGKNEHTI